MMQLLKFTPVFFLAGLALVCIIIFLNLFIFFTGYTITFLNHSFLYLTDSFNYFFSSSQGTDCISRNIQWLMSIYCGLCIGFVLNNIVDPDKLFLN
jgi:hypothetical protein